MFRSISTVKADLAQAEFGITGKGIVWAVLGTGVSSTHPHFQRYKNLKLPEPLYHMDYSNSRKKITKSERRDICQDRLELSDLLVDKRFRVSVPVDRRGYGTAVAGIIAGQSNDRDYVMKGLAPEAKIVSVKVLDDEGKGDEFDALYGLEAIQHINEGKPDLLIHGVVIPLSYPYDVRNFACGLTPLCVAVERLINSGVVVVTTAGNHAFDSDRNASVEGGITDPGNAELAITVGATHRTSPLIYGPSFFSARGPTADGRRKPDLLAPGEKITVPYMLRESPAVDPQPSKGRTRRRNGTATEVIKDTYIEFDGTQFAAAHVAGAAAALMSARNDLIGKPKEVKDILLRTAVDLGREVMYQGAGLLDVLAAVRDAVETTKPARSVVGPLKLFCSYAHEDKPLWLEFKSHLSSLGRQGLIEVWFDGMIEAGQRWEEEIYRKLETADIILLLVSSHFMDSEFCYSKELARAVEREAKGTTRIVPVRIRPVDLEGTIVGKLQLLPSEGKPITSFRDAHEGWAETTAQLRVIAQKMREKKP